VRPLADIEQRLEALASSPPAGDDGVASELLSLGEEVLEHWVVARGLEPTGDTREGFRLLALHRQGCTDEPSFNACRETCRELVYHYNLVSLEPQHPDAGQRLRMMTLVANHLFLFVAGKLQVRGLGDFCCASRPLRQDAASPDPA
jgi:hypothetical protein